jgi:hypothetical protein
MTIEVFGLFDLDSCVGDYYNSFYAKGHHDPQEFVAQVKEEYDIDLDPAGVTTGHARWCPTSAPPGYPYPTRMFLYPEKPGRGAFPVTYCERRL